ncbi:abasic site processing protein HMCES isoform X2 [Lampris incognitus]|uniref:abasic site processing protein HMCES isoform X2 n=1 Tax=Lampris incognitus TaxID=2546036 RepID=UPI0024B4A0EF|nr:abasic site processing protein HMCES isoform X2 [Lampris incognitus]
MCGRTACTLHPDEVSRASVYRDRGGKHRQPRWRDGDAEKYQPSYNKSPHSMSPVLLSRRHFDENPILKGQRCVILADGFYEWRKEEKGKQPFFIYFPQTQSQGETEDQVEEAKHGDNLKTACTQKGGLTDLAEEEKATVSWTGWRLLTIAGLFDCWTPASGGHPLYSCSVITVDASPNLQGIHDRMPAILDGEEEVRKWLDFGEVKCLDALKLLKPKNILTFHPVSTLVNNSRNNFPKCLQPVDPQTKKELEPTTSSKMMRNWLKKSTPTKRKEQDTHRAQGEKQIKQEEQPKSARHLDQWLQGANKKARTNWNI